MKNKNVLIGSGLIILATISYFYFKNKNEQKKPYTDADLDNALKGFINKVINYLSSKGKTERLKSVDEIFPPLKYRFEQAKLKGKDLSRKNVDYILNLLYIDSLVRDGDVSQGVLTENKNNQLLDFLGSNFHDYFSKS